jgi:hypothetical protein
MVVATQSVGAYVLKNIQNLEYISKAKPVATI